MYQVKTGIYLFFTIGLISIFLTTSTLVNAAAQPSKPFVTYPGMGPDKWASIWLLKRHIRPAQGIHILPSNADSTQGILFDHPQGVYKRTQHESTYEALYRSFQPNDKTAQLLGDIINDIEVNLWRPNTQEDSLTIEQGFRTLQRTYMQDPEALPLSCYLSFFDHVYQQLNQKIQSPHAQTITVDNLLPSKDCVHDPVSGLLRQDRLVPEITVPQLFSLLKNGKKVVFVDTREPEEFAENHIPGAMNLLIRQVNTQTPELLQGADIVISYCVKDFRGFEMARALHKVGVKNAAILNPYGIKGWIDAGLPVTRVDEMSENEALRALNTCVEEENSCL